MSSPVREIEQLSFPTFAPDPPNPQHDRRSSDEDGTLQGEVTEDGIDRNRLRLTTSYASGQDHLQKDNRLPSLMSPTSQREQSRRLDDDLEMLRAERVVSNAERSNQESSMGRSKSMHRSRSRTAGEPIDDFDADTTPIHEKAKIYQPPPNPSTKIAKVFKRIHNSSFLVRYFCYITPLCILLLIPTLFGFLLFKEATVGGVQLFWFGIWLEIVWLTLWAGRVSL
jgi:hypothetical protein